MIPYEKALELVLKNTKKLKAVKVSLENSLGMVLDEDIISKIEMPPFNKASMDGYALRSDDTLSKDVRFKCIGLIQAGDKFKKNVGKKECVKIMTGAPLPSGTNSVIMVEKTKQHNETVEIFQSLRSGENVCRRGEDIQKGQRVLKKGKRISVADISLLASVGRREVRVIKKPCIAILNTGNEIMERGEKLQQNKIYNSNGPQLLALLKVDDIECVSLGIAKDRPEDLKSSIKKGLSYDGLLISGGVSMGDYDLIPDILRGLGVKEVFHNVKIKPGKPLFFGTKNKKFIFGIPGNPVSNFVIYFLFVQSAIKNMSGIENASPIFEKGILKKNFIKKNVGRRRFIAVVVQRQEGVNYLTPLASHGSADIFTLSGADGFMMMGDAESEIKANTLRSFFTWKK